MRKGREPNSSFQFLLRYERTRMPAECWWPFETARRWPRVAQWRPTQSVMVRPTSDPGSRLQTVPARSPTAGGLGRRRCSVRRRPGDPGAIPDSPGPVVRPADASGNQELQGTTLDMAAWIRCLSAQKNVVHGFFCMTRHRFGAQKHACQRTGHRGCALIGAPLRHCRTVPAVVTVECGRDASIDAATFAEWHRCCRRRAVASTSSMTADGGSDSLRGRTTSSSRLRRSRGRHGCRASWLRCCGPTATRLLPPST